MGGITEIKINITVILLSTIHAIAFDVENLPETARNSAALRDPRDFAGGAAFFLCPTHQNGISRVPIPYSGY
jgi:hypothetical protein